MNTETQEFLDKVFEAAVIPELWPGVLEQFCGLFGGRGGAMMSISGGSMQFAATTVYAPNFERYVAKQDYVLNVRPGRALATRHQGFLRDVDLCSLQELEADPVYAEYLRPAGVGWTVGTVIPIPGGDMLGFEIGRAPDLGPFNLEILTRLDAFRPHLARSAHLAARLGREQAVSATAALGVVGLPAAVLTSDRRVVAANMLFETLAPRIEATAFNKLAIADPTADRLLQAEFERLKEVRGAIVRSIPVKATVQEPALIVHVTPVRRNAHDIFSRAHWIVVVTPVVAGGFPDADLLQGLFDLTAAEARVARGLLEGGSANGIANGNAVSVTTVRTQIRSVLAKTGTSRQIDLVALLSGSVLGKQGP